MGKIIKNLPAPAVTAAIAFLLVQVFCELFIPTLTAGMVNNGIVKGDSGYILRQGCVMLSVSALGFAAALLNTNISAKISYKLGCQLRCDIYKKVSQFSNSEFDKFGTSALITRNTNDVTQVQNLIEMGLKFLILAPLYLVGGVFMAYRLSPSLSTIFFALVPVVAAAAIGVSLYANPLFAQMQRQTDKLNLIFREGLNGVKVIRAFGKEKQEHGRYAKTNDEYTHISIKANAVLGLLMPLMALIMSLATIAITWIGGQAINSGAMEIGTMMGVANYSMQILMGFMLITNVISSIPRGRTSAKRIAEVLDMPLSICEPEQAIEAGGNEATLAFDKAGFRYPGAEKDTLQNICFDVRKGQTLAIVGSTGSGKSTVVNLLSRFYDVTDGSIRLCGADIRELSQKDLHEKVSLVPQKSLLFFGTIRDNLLLGNPTASDDEIWAALETAQAASFVRELEGGLDATVEKGGGNFSGGQKQRLCIARAILKKASVYVFDDSFSALDFKTDALVRAGLKDKMSASIAIIVAQRIGTIMGADKIAVLDNGHVIGLGTHDELKESNKVYQEIIASQYGKEGAA
jgi:ATP-binding cassette subfamily B protein